MYRKRIITIVIGVLVVAFVGILLLRRPQQNILNVDPDVTSTSSNNLVSPPVITSGGESNDVVLSDSTELIPVGTGNSGVEVARSYENGVFSLRAVGENLPIPMSDAAYHAWIVDKRGSGQDVEYIGRMIFIPQGLLAGKYIVGYSNERQDLMEFNGVFITLDGIDAPDVPGEVVLEGSF